MFHRRWKQLIAISLASCALAGCGGGGGSGGGGGNGRDPPTPAAFVVGGSVNGLVGSVILENAGGAQLKLAANGAFALSQTFSAGASYAVTVAAQPELQTCTVANGSGTASTNVTNIELSCADAPPTLTLSLQRIKTFRFAWTPVPGVTHYRLLEDPTGSSELTQLGADIDASTTSLDHIVPLHRRVNARYAVQACAATRCIGSSTVTASGSLAEAVGYFKAASITAGDQFGTSVALSADSTTLAVGVPFEDSNARDSGAVYVFVRDGAGPAWVQEAYLKASSARQGDRFGQALALDSAGSTLAVGAPARDGAAGSDSGAVYVFERSDGVWTEQPVLTASNAGQMDFFGLSVALSDRGQLAVGAWTEDGAADGTGGDSLTNAGAVYVFSKHGLEWREDAYLKASNANGHDGFGISVALSRDGVTLAVGAIDEDSDATGVEHEQSSEGASTSGAVYVFTHDEQWAQQAYIKASNTGMFDFFGRSLALSGDGSTLAVGATFESSAATGIDDDQSDDSIFGAGAAYVFVRLGDTWTQQAYIKASNTVRLDGSGDLFGSSLALSIDGSILAVGAPEEDSSAIGIAGDDGDNSANQSGAVYVFERSNDTWAQRAYVKQSNTSTSHSRGYFGVAVALAGDGTTLAAGASCETGSTAGIRDDEESPPIEDAGAVYLY